MKVEVSGHHVTVTDALRQHVEKKFERISHHNQGINQVHVTLTVEKHLQKAEANVHLAGQDIFASGKDKDMYIAIDQLVDKLDRQVVKHKEITKAAHR